MLQFSSTLYQLLRSIHQILFESDIYHRGTDRTVISIHHILLWLCSASLETPIDYCAQTLLLHYPLWSPSHFLFVLQNDNHDSFLISPRALKLFDKVFSLVARFLNLQIGRWWP